MPRAKKRTGVGRRGRPSALARISTADLRRELERRQSMLQDLIRQRDALNAELHELQGGAGEVNGMPSAPAGRRRGRPPGSGKRGRRGGRGGNKTNLVDALRATLNGKTMSVSELADQVRKDGYKTKSENFRTIVNQALIANPSAFKKVARGQYTAR